MADAAKLLKDPEAFARWVARSVADRLSSVDPVVAPPVTRSVDADNDEHITLAVEFNSFRVEVSGWDGYEEYEVSVTRLTGQEAGHAEFDGRRTAGGRLFRCLDKIERRQMTAWAAEVQAEIEGIGQ